MNLHQRITARLEAMKEPPWYVQLLLIVAFGFVASVAAWSLIAVFGWLAAMGASPR